MVDTIQQSPESSVVAQSDLHETLSKSDLARFTRASELLDGGLDVNGLAQFPWVYAIGGNMSPQHKVTALYDAARRGDYEAVEFLLSRGADPKVKNITGTGPRTAMFPPNAIETLCGLDSMRTSKNRRVVELAEELYGVESEEDFIRRRDAFDSLFPWYYIRNTKEGGFYKPKLKRVRSVLMIGGARRKPRGAFKQNRYELRVRNPDFFYF